MHRDFHRIAVVNRGEAAARFIHAARELSLRGDPIRSIALYTHPDHDSLFVREADERYDLGEPTFVDPADGSRKNAYLDLPRLERALVATRAEAAWVGWGFVAEQAEFVDLCERLGVVFIGPPAHVMRALGDKITSKQIAERVGVPVLPWSGGPIREPGEAAAVAARLGYPVLLKASAGGGGRGIRLVTSDDAMRAAFERARAEALQAFGDGTLFVERCATGARHVEVQVLADHHETVWALGTRDCSVQRRKQKLVEEAPSPLLSAVGDRALRDAAVRLARAAGYRNAGTVEFLVDPRTEAFWFMEVNTRLQVEHPVTEMTTGVDLVQHQLRIARGEALPPEPPAGQGHAIEVRLNAEDADAGFAPAPGLVEVFRFVGGPGVRIDTGVSEGDTVPPQFDSMLAKVIAWGPTRDEALSRLRRALGQSRVVVRGGTTNRTFLLELLGRPEIASCQCDVGWLDREAAAGTGPPRPHAAVALLRAAVEVYETEIDLERSHFFALAARGRPRIEPQVGRTVELAYEGQTYAIAMRRVGPDAYRAQVEGHRVPMVVERHTTAPVRERRAQGAEWRLRVGGRSHRVLLTVQPLRFLVEVDGVGYPVSRDNAGVVRASAPGIVVALPVRPGDLVAAGDRLAVVEAMKMEVAVTSPFGGRVREVRVNENVQVDAGTALVVVEPFEERPVARSADRLSFADLAERAPRGAAGARCAFDDVLALALGYDCDAGRLATAGPACPDTGTEEDAEATLAACGSEILEAFADLTALFARGGGRSAPGEPEALSAEESLFTYLRTLDAGGDRLPNGFVESLRRAVARHGVHTLDRSEALLESLFRVCKAHARAAELVGPVSTILERQLDQRRPGAPPPSRELLDRLIATTAERYPAVSDLARELRYRCYEQPLLERAREAVYAAARADVDALARSHPGVGRRAIVDRLVDCPQPLASLLLGRFEGADGTLRQLMMEVLTRRYYRIRALQNVRTVAVDGHMFTLLEYDHEGRHVQAVATHADYDHVARVLELAHPIVAAVPPGHDIALDLYVWRDGPVGDAEANEASLRAVLNATGFPRPLRRVVVAVTGPQAGLGMGGMQHFTYRQPNGEFVEERFYRGAHPMMGKRLQLWRMANFAIERLPSPEDVYLLHAVARDNPRDERLVAVAEVRDLTPVHDPSGRVVGLPQLERMLLEALAGIRRAQAKRPSDRRLHWNRVLLYVWPPLTVPRADLEDLLERLARETAGLGIQKLLVRARVPDERGGLDDTLVTVADPESACAVTFGAPPEALMASMSPYEQKVVRARQQGTVYPYELLKVLLSPRVAHNGSRVDDVAPGQFVEYDLDEHFRLVPVSRPPGANTSNIIVGVARNFTRKYPEGMTRIAIFGDPSRDLGALAEPECRRIIAALDLAGQKQVPVEWFALSAGARIAMDSGTENMDWIALVLRRIVTFTQEGGEINVVVNGINVGAQPYWNAEATMLMHTRGILVMMPESAMVLTGKRALDYSGGVSAEDNQGIGGYDRVMGPNGQAQYFARDVVDACRILLAHYDHTHVAPAERFPRRAISSDPVDRDVCAMAYGDEPNGYATVGEIFAEATNPGRKRPFDIRRVMAAVVDQDHPPLERWKGWRDAENAVVWDAHLGGFAVALLGVESRPLQRLGFIPADGPDQWTAGTLFPQSSRKIARAINAASGNRPVVVLANLSGFDGSPESLRLWQLEYGAEIGRAVVNFRGPFVFCVISRYHGGAFVVFSNALNPGVEVVALEGTHASVIGGAPAAAVVFAREVERRTTADPRVRGLDEEILAATGPERARLRARRAELVATLRSEKLGAVAEEFDRVHSVERARKVGSVHRIIQPEMLRPYLVDAIDRGIQRELAWSGRDRRPDLALV